MAETTPWASVQQCAPTDALRALLGKDNSFAEWPVEARTFALSSMKAGVALGHVPSDFNTDAIVGTATLSSSGIELRAHWEPAK